MKHTAVLVLVATLAFSVPVLGSTVREVDAAELRGIVAAGNAISLKRVIDQVAKTNDGEPIEARAFAADDVFYRIVLKRNDGSLVSVIINARTGEPVTTKSEMGRLVTTAARSGAGKATGTSKAAAAGNAGGNGNSGGNGNGNGNGGGNGGGNGNGKN